MAVFYILLLVPIMIQHLSIGRKNINYGSKNRTAVFVFFVLCTMLLALRHSIVGVDTKVYLSAFKRLSLMNWDLIGMETTEVGYMYYNKIIALFSDNPQVFFAITGAITVALIYPTYKRLTVDASFTIVLFCTMPTFIMMFSGIRQMLAVGLGVVAYELTRRKKLFFFILVVVLAMTFHVSAFMLAFMYPLYHVKITKTWLFVIIPSMVVMFIFNERIFTFLLMILSLFTSYEGEITETGAYTMLILFLMFSVFAFLVPDESSLDKETNGLRNFLLFSCALQFFAPLHTLAMRMNYYYIIFIPLLLPKVISASAGRWKQFALVGRYVMLVGFLVYFFYNAYNGKNLHVFPYHFFWEAV